jgi:SAM-dependent methyltransferase
MDPALYPRMAAVEDEHWWFASRRAICAHILDRVALPNQAAILEPGCGTGGNFAMLARRGRLYAMDADESALRFAAARGLAELARGSLPGDIPFGDVRFDLAVMTDVLEHLDDEAASLAALRARLKPDGWLLMTVPAMRWLWSDHDATHHHRRRYHAAELRARVGDAGFRIEYLSYYNFILFPAIAAARLMSRIRSGSGGANGRHDLAMPPRAINSILLRLFSSERHVVGAMRIPVGVSLIVLARA